MTHGYQRLRLDSLTDFEWDSVYFFKGEADAMYISHIIGFRWQGEDLPEDYRRLLFVRGQQVVSYTDFPAKGEVSPDKLPMPIYLYTCQQGYGLSRARARLAIFRACADGGTFDIVPLDCFKEAYFRNLLEQGCTDETMAQLRGPHLYDSLGCIIPVPDTSRSSYRPHEGR